MHCLLLVISDSALLPFSATGGGRKAEKKAAEKAEKAKREYEEAKKKAAEEENKIVTLTPEYSETDERESAKPLSFLWFRSFPFGIAFSE